MKLLTQEEEINLHGLRALYFYASWMPFHKKMLVMIDKMESKFKNIEFTSIDVEAFKGLCKRFDVDSIPSILIFKDGVEVKRVTGMVLTSAFRSALADICTSES